jgi:hypothetical protein
MSDVQNAHGLISAATHDGNEIGAVKNVQAGSNFRKMKVANQGKRGFAVNRVVGFERMVTLSAVGGAAVPFESKGSVVVSVVRADGATIDTWTWLDMVAMEDTCAASDGDGNHDVVTQAFEYEGDGDTDNFTNSLG